MFIFKALLGLLLASQAHAFLSRVAPSRLRRPWGASAVARAPPPTQPQKLDDLSLVRRRMQELQTRDSLSDLDKAELAGLAALQVQLALEHKGVSRLSRDEAATYQRLLLMADPGLGSSQALLNSLRDKQAATQSPAAPSLFDDLAAVNRRISWMTAHGNRRSSDDIKRLAELNALRDELQKAISGEHRMRVLEAKGLHKLHEHEAKEHKTLRVAHAFPDKTWADRVGKVREELRNLQLGLSPEGHVPLPPDEQREGSPTELRPLGLLRAP